MEGKVYYQKEPLSNYLNYRSTFTVLVFIPKWSRREKNYCKLDVIVSFVLFFLVNL